MNNFEKELKLLQEEFDRKVTKLAEEVRAELVIPACHKYKLDFISGMGRFLFFRGELQIADEDDAKRYNIPALKPIFEVLNLEVSHGQYLGYWVSDVTLAKT